MISLDEKFKRLAIEHAPGQEVRQKEADLSGLLIGNPLKGVPLDFSHGNVDAFEPTPGSLEAFVGGVRLGGRRAYTEYRGDAEIRDDLATKLARFTGAPVSSGDGLIITPGTQGALFLAIASTVTTGDRVAIVQPDYFANRRLVEFFGGQAVPARLDYLRPGPEAGLDLSELESAFRAGAKVFVFSNPNNPVGVVYSRAEIEAIADLAEHHGVLVIVDQLYSRLRYDDVDYTHLRVTNVDPTRVVTIMGPSKTESLSGYRLGVAFGSAQVIARMERLQSVMSLRAAGYSQSVLGTWFSEPDGWMRERVRLHQAIRDDLSSRFASAEDVQVRLPQAGSYLFPHLPKLSVGLQDFVRILRTQAGVTVTPGTEFSVEAQSSIRLNFSQVHSAAVGAVDRVVEMVQRYRA